MKAIEKYKTWLNGNFLNKNDKEILKNMNEETIKENFSSDLNFGTAGIRGIMDLGTNKINIYNIKRVTQGLSNYLIKHYNNPSVVIGYDTRNNSYEYAITTALVLNNNKIKTYLFKDISSTPLVSYAVKYLKCSSGIVITSSHNASVYNGYKVYNDKGCQILEKEANLIIDEINNTNYNIKEENINNEYFNYVNESINESFVEENEKVIINKNIIDNYASKLKITYTSLHGTGIKVIPFIFEKYKIRYNLVNEQCKIDKDFTYAPEPNPEYLYNYDLAFKYAEDLNSDVIIATDPDADRIGVLYKKDDNYEMIDGNMLGNIFLYYILNNKKILKNNYCVRSIVSSNMFDKIADLYNAKVVEVLTGCKNIVQVKNNDKDNYIFGFEESLGYVFNIDINDKNSISSTIFLIEILSYLKSIDSSLDQYIQEIYNKFGYYKTKTISLTLNQNKIESLMNKLRKENLFNEKEKIDYLKEENDLKTNALKFILNENEYFMIRPSGTEPKIKIYMIVNDTNMDKCNLRINNLETKIKEIIKE